LVDYLKLKDYLKKSPSSKEKIDMLLDKVEELENEKRKELGVYTLRDFLEETSPNLGNEENNNDEENSNDINKVKLMTIHQAKGLEFKYVFVIGLEEGYYPSFLCSGNEDEVEEERRILYVAITRAKINCYISYAHKRTSGDEEREREVSRFVDEISNEDLVQVYSPPLYSVYMEKNKILDEIKSIDNKINDITNTMNEVSNEIINYNNKDNGDIQDNKNHKNINNIDYNDNIQNDRVKKSRKKNNNNKIKEIDNVIKQNENKIKELDENEDEEDDDDDNFFLFKENMKVKEKPKNEDKEKKIIY